LDFHFLMVSVPYGLTKRTCKPTERAPAGQ
jgi:hypothetical protein